jgi:GT2 family glycosyltransferase
MTYGGCTLISSKTIPNFPNGKNCLVDIINGNVVLIPHSVYLKVGNLDWSFIHAIGDNDYSLRAKKLGIFSYSTGTFIGTCSDKSSLPKWCIPEVPIRERLKNLYSPLGNAEPFKFFKYQNRHFGISKALKNFISTHIRVFFPTLWI